MRKINKTEQWLLNGNCKKCRKKSYCSKPCTAHKQGVTTTLGQAVANLMLRALKR